MNERDRVFENIDNLPNDRDLILGCGERLGAKAKAAGVPERDLTDRVHAPWTAEYQAPTREPSER
jgi:hypothetical protein